MQTGNASYQATIRWTTHGVPHISAVDAANLAFGQGWAQAQDHFATIADQVLKVRSERARYFGPGLADQHINTDFGYLALGVRARAEQQLVSQPPEVVEMVAAYAAGLNQWLADVGRAGLPEWCRQAEWIQPFSTVDLFTLYADLAIIASGRNLAAYIGAAQPPGSIEPPTSEPPLPPLDGGLGSNGWAIGRDRSSSGRGMIMANPHFPWHGEARFWECHLQIPGELDVYGASLLGTPGVSIGFNEHVGWTHTFSRGHRFTVYKLSWVGNPLTYRHGDRDRSLTSETFTVAVQGEDGMTDLSRTLYATHHGPMVDLPFLGWTDDYGFSYRDANLENDQFLPLIADLNRSTSVADFRSSLARHGGLPWVNTMVADTSGDCLYIDSSPTPALPESVQEAWETDLASDPITNLLFSARVALLDGSDPSHDWLEVPGQHLPGVVPFDQCPVVERSDYTFNANDPYWLPHATDQLPQHSAFHGLHHRPVSPRTRMNARLLEGGGPVRPTGVDGKITLDDLRTMVLGNQSLMVELLLDALIDRLRAVPDDADGAEDLARTADILSRWNRTFDLDSVGAVVFREFLGSIPEDELRSSGRLFAEGFDPLNPVETPAQLQPAFEDVGRDPWIEAIRQALAALSIAEIPMDAALGDVQYVERGGRRIPLHGANEVEGIANVVAPLGALDRSDLEPLPEPPAAIPGRTERTGLRVGGYPIVYGASFLMFLEFTADGPEAVGLLAYGQSGDPDSPHYVDQPEAFSEKKLRPLLFRDADVAADVIREQTVISR